MSLTYAVLLNSRQSAFIDRMYVRMYVHAVTPPQKSAKIEQTVLYQATVLLLFIPLKQAWQWQQSVEALL